MGVVNPADLVPWENPQGPCLSCLYEDELDGNGLCASCSKRDPELNRVILELLGKPYRLDVSASESVNHQ